MKKLLIATIAAVTITFTACKKDEDTTPTNVTADFSYTSENNYTQTEFTFTSTSQNASSYSWDFGDGSTSTLQNPKHAYNSPGNYTVKLIASSAGSSGTSSKTITVLAHPTKLMLESVVLNGTPLTNSNGGGWDSDNTGPDIFFELSSSGSVVTKSSNRNDVRTQDFPLTWTANPIVQWCTLNSTGNIITFKDYDTGTSDQVMFGVELNTTIFRSLNYPKQITYKQNGNDLLINVSYQ